MNNGEEEILDFEEVLEREVEKLLFEKNHARTAALSDLWLDLFVEKIMQMEAPEEKKLEIMFMMLTNSLLDMVFGVVPENIVLEVAKSIDEFLKIALVNKKYGTDLMSDFRNEFIEREGKDFDSEEQLDKALERFELEWFNTKRESLENRTPRRALKEMGEKYNL